MYSYWIGGIKVECSNINELKDFSENLAEVAKEAGMEFPNSVSDVCFAIDADYQNFHNLDENNWNSIH